MRQDAPQRINIREPLGHRFESFAIGLPPVECAIDVTHQAEDMPQGSGTIEVIIDGPAETLLGIAERYMYR